MNEIIIANNSLPQLCGCGLFAASESFIHTDRVPDFCVLIYVIDGCIYVTEGDTDYEVNAGELLILKNGVHHFGKKKIQKGTKWIFLHFRIRADCNASPFYPDASPLGAYDATAESILTLPKFLDSVSARFEKELKNIYRICSIGRCVQEMVYQSAVVSAVILACRKRTGIFKQSYAERQDMPLSVGQYRCAFQL